MTKLFNHVFHRIHLQNVYRIVSFINNEYLGHYNYLGKNMGVEQVVHMAI
jgi:hypothetical protein